MFSVGGFMFSVGGFLFSVGGFLFSVGGFMFSVGGFLRISIHKIKLVEWVHPYNSSWGIPPPACTSYFFWYTSNLWGILFEVSFDAHLL